MLTDGLLLFAAAGASLEMIGTAIRRRRRRKAQEAGEAPAASSGHAPLTRFEKICVTAVGTGLFLALISALAPVTSWDAGVAHLALPSDYVREGHIYAFEGNAYSAYPHLMHTLYTAAFSQGGERAAMLLAWTMAVLGCVIVFGAARRIAGRTAGLVAAAILATAPIFVDQGGTASIDLAFAVMFLASVSAFLAWRNEGRMVWIVLAGIFAGSACGIRHTGYLTGVLMLAWVVLSTKEKRWPVTAIFATIMAVAAGPWLLRSFLVTGNPFYPFFNEMLASAGPADPAITNVTQHESLRSVRLMNYFLFPWQIIMQPYRFDGISQSPGPWVLLLGVPGFFWGGKPARALGIMSLVGGTALFFFRQYARYYLPFFLIMMVVAGVGAVRMRGLRYLVAPLLILSFAYGLTYEAAAVHFKVPVVLGLESREEYLMRRVERYGAFRWVNENVAPDQTVFTLDFRSYYIVGKTYQNQESSFPLLGQSIWDQLAWFKERDIQYLFYPVQYIKESPGYYGERNLWMLFRQWRHSKFFVLVQELDLPRPDGSGIERVEIYEIHYE
jgi:MFS family permease